MICSVIIAGPTNRNTAPQITDSTPATINTMATMLLFTAMVCKIQLLFQPPLKSEVMVALKSSPEQWWTRGGCSQEGKAVYTPPVLPGVRGGLQGHILRSLINKLMLIHNTVTLQSDDQHWSLLCCSEMNI